MTGSDLHDRLERAAAQHQAGRTAEAELGYRAVLARQPDHADALHLLGVLLAQTGRPGEGEPLVARAAALCPGDAGMQLSLGTIRRALGQMAGAESALRTALTLDPGSARACLHLGCLTDDRGRAAEAEGLLNRAVAASPDLAEGWARLGRLADLRGDTARAADCLERALSLGATPAAAIIGRLIGVSARLARWPRLQELRPAFAKAVEGDREGAAPLPVLIGQPLVEEWHLRAARAMAEATRRQTPPAAPSPIAGGRTAAQRLRIGYLAADSGRHPGAWRIIAAHDRSAIDIFMFDLSAAPGTPAPAGLSSARFFGLGGDDGAAAARRIQAAGLDLLVDLDGIGPGTRPDILARRPAPVIVHWPGHPGTLGGLADYVLADAVTIPPGRERFHAEAVVRLPGSGIRPQQLPSPQPAPAPDRRPHGLPPEAMVFCAFHDTGRIGRDCFAGWLRILAAVPHGVLWLLPPPAEAARTLLGAAAAAGIDPRRLIFAPVTAPADPHCLAAADLFLDSRPVGAGRMAGRALAAGLPVLTCMGDIFASRRAASLLTALDLTDLITATPTAFEATAIALAHDPAVLAAVRARLADRLACPGGPFDAGLTAASLEVAFRVMADRAARGLSPAAFSLRSED